MAAPMLPVLWLPALRYMYGLWCVHVCICDEICCDCGVVHIMCMCSIVNYVAYTQALAQCAVVNEGVMHARGMGWGREFIVRTIRVSMVIFM